MKKRSTQLLHKSSFCRACNHRKALIDNKINEFNALYEGHKEDYSSKYMGSARKMGIGGITKIFGGSEKKYGVQCVKYVCDGVSKTLTGIITSNP